MTASKHYGNDSALKYSLCKDISIEVSKDITVVSIIGVLVKASFRPTTHIV